MSLVLFTDVASALIPIVDIKSLVCSLTIISSIELTELICHNILVLYHHSSANTLAKSFIICLYLTVVVVPIGFLAVCSHLLFNFHCVNVFLISSIAFCCSSLAIRSSSSVLLLPSAFIFLMAADFTTVSLSRANVFRTSSD